MLRHLPAGTMGATVSIPSITVDESAEPITPTAAAGNRPRHDENPRRHWRQWITVQF